MRSIHRLTYTFRASILLIAAGCGGGETAPEAAAEEHGHGGIAVTIWTDETELFFEYPPMIAGQQSGPWAIHLTRLSDFSPVTEGTLTLAFRRPDGQVYTVRSDAPVRPGIYTPAPRLPAPGAYEVVMDLSGTQHSDRIPVGRIQVYASENDVPQGEPPHPEGISFLKEQQWPIDFAVARAEEREMPYVIPVSGEIIPAAGRVAEVAAPVSGLALAGSNITAPAPGNPVRAGQTLVVLSPTSRDNSYAQTKANVERLQREVERLERLYQAEAIPEKRLVEARHDLEVAEAALTAMGGASGDGYNYPVRAPISGIVQERHFNPGGSVEAGEVLFRIVNPGVVWLSLRVPAQHAAVAQTAQEAVFTVEGSPRQYRAGTVVSIGSSIDPQSRTLPVALAVENSDGSLKIGMFAQAQLSIGGSQSGVAVPNAAIQQEDGQPVAYVQVGGETFQRRPLVLGASDGEYTLVQSGVQAGEHVVTEGAYQVYLASLNTSEIGSHGHPH